MARTALGVNDFRGHAIGQPTVVSNVTYSGALQCDVYQPSVANRPVIIVLHGGAWGTVPQTRSTAPFYGQISRRFAEYGFVAVNADFTPANASPQDAVDDILALVTWCRANAATYNMDSTRVAIVGISSGGHAALMAGIQGTPGGSRPDAVVGWSPVTDMVDSYTYVPTEMTNYFGVTLPGNEALYAAWSPTEIVTATCCPLRIVGSDAEETDTGSEGPPLTQFTDMEAAAEALSVSVTMRIFTGTVHGLFDGATKDNGVMGTNDMPGACNWITSTLGQGSVTTSRSASSGRAASVSRAAA